MKKIKKLKHWKKIKTIGKNWGKLERLEKKNRK